jgi:hypothetical protein
MHLDHSLLWRIKKVKKKILFGPKFSILGENDESIYSLQRRTKIKTCILFL